MGAIDRAACRKIPRDCDQDLESFQVAPPLGYGPRLRHEAKNVRHQDLKSLPQAQTPHAHKVFDRQEDGKAHSIAASVQILYDEAVHDRRNKQKDLGAQEFDCLS